MTLISSDYIVADISRIKKRLLKGKVLDVGCGNRKICLWATGIDCVKFPDVDIVADAMNLPFKDRTFDTIWCEAVLEHVKSPVKAVSEMYRVLKTGGSIFAVVPFNHKYHEHPSDYQRYTLQGLKELFKDFDGEVGVYRGPTSALLSFLTEYFTLFSFTDNKKINYVIKGAFMVLLFPWKYLDKLLIKNRRSHELSNALYFIGKKVRK